MELREWALSILTADTLAGKLLAPDALTDLEPGPALIWQEPVRPAGMGFNRCTKENKLPAFHTHHSIENRAICLHRFAGHELLAVEIMAFTLLAFPEAPAAFRRGVAHTLKEEQGHVQLYRTRLEQLGVQFGDFPLFRHFWKHTPYIQSPLHYVSMMCLTFEMANLDFAPLYGKSFAQAGDEASAQLMATILRDEIAHVSFGWRWLKRLKQETQTEWQAWEQILNNTLLTPKRAKGFVMHAEPRTRAGLPPEWITQLKTYK